MPNIQKEINTRSIKPTRTRIKKPSLPVIAQFPVFYFSYIEYSDIKTYFIIKINTK